MSRAGAGRGQGTIGRYLQQRQGAQGHLVLLLCQALPTGKDRELRGLKWEHGSPGSFLFTLSGSFRGFLLAQLWAWGNALLAFSAGPLVSP